MKYFLINVKKIYKNKLNSIPVFIIILFLASLYVGNLKSATIEFDLDSPVSIKEDINSTSEQIKLFEKNLKSVSSDREEYINIKNDLNEYNGWACPSVIFISFDPIIIDCINLNSLNKRVSLVAVILFCNFGLSGDWIAV